MLLTLFLVFDFAFFVISAHSAVVAHNFSGPTDIISPTSDGADTSISFIGLSSSASVMESTAASITSGSGTSGGTATIICVPIASPTPGPAATTSESVDSSSLPTTINPTNPVSSSSSFSETIAITSSDPDILSDEPSSSFHHSSRGHVTSPSLANSPVTYTSATTDGLVTDLFSKTRLSPTFDSSSATPRTASSGRNNSDAAYICFIVGGAVTSTADVFTTQFPSSLFSISSSATPLPSF
ncbi:hypothetical protein C8Q75DRAFT_802054 [Abortiporus biennis]|nr:hypothetical protein C8Q75DRAFT_802054 [Abortiporus biennis]